MGDCADVVRQAMRGAGLSDAVISEFEQADLLRLHDGGYTSAFRIKNATREDLEKSKLVQVLVGVLVNSLGGERRKELWRLGSGLCLHLAPGEYSSAPWLT